MSVLSALNQLFHVLYRSSKLKKYLYATVLFLMVCKLRNIYVNNQRNKKKLPPGPNGLPIIGSLFSCIDTVKFASDLSKKYGSITMAYIGFQRFVFLHNIKSINIVFKNKYAIDREYDESLLFQHLKPYELMSALTPYKYWHVKRKIFQSVMLSKLDSSFVNKVHNKSLEYVFISMNKCIENNQPWIIMKDIEYINFHLVYYSLFGTYCSPNSDKQHKILKYLSDFPKEMSYDILLRYLKITKILPSKLIKYIFPTATTFESYIEYLLYSQLNYDECVFDINDKKWSEYFTKIRNNKNACVAAKLIAEHRYNPIDSSNKMSILQELFAFFLAAIDTSIHTNEFGLVLIAKYQREQTVIYNELYNIFGNDIQMNKIKLKDVLSKLHYFRAFIHELLRLSNVSPIGIAHYNRDKDIKVDKYIIPKQSVIISDIKTANMNDKYWHKQTNGNVKKLCLDIWLDDNKIFKLNVHKDKLMSFSVGPRNCAGKALAMRSLYLIMAKLILLYKFEIADGNKDIEMKQIFEFSQILYPKIHLKISKR